MIHDLDIISLSPILSLQTLQEFRFSKKQSPNRFLKICFGSNPQDEKAIIALLGIGNRTVGYTLEFLDSIIPFVKACGFLIEAFRNHQKVASTPQPLEGISSLIAAFKNPETGIAVKDRKYHLKTYRQCFVGKDAVNWFLTNASTFVKSKEEAISLGNKLMSMNVFQNMNKGDSFSPSFDF
jgi:hypothetical protein